MTGGQMSRATRCVEPIVRNVAMATSMNGISPRTTEVRDIHFHRAK